MMSWRHPFTHAQVADDGDVFDKPNALVRVVQMGAQDSGHHHHEQDEQHDRFADSYARSQNAMPPVNSARVAAGTTS